MQSLVYNVSYLPNTWNIFLRISLIIPNKIVGIYHLIPFCCFVQINTAWGMYLKNQAKKSHWFTKLLRNVENH